MGTLTEHIDDGFQARRGPQRDAGPTSQKGVR